MSAEHQQILAGIAALEAQRALLRDAVVDASIAALRSKLVELTTAPADEPAQTLRQVSILFLDVVGSTTLSQHLDPEDIHAVMDGALARCTTVVQAHHGKVLQYAGDNLLAAFGATEAKEDDAERAVRCGLALLAEGRWIGAEVQAAHGYAGFDVRVGIHTGRVLLGGGVDAEGTIRGITVNIAARMEQTAPAGALRISHDTYAQVRGIFDVEPQDPISVKGVDTPIQSYFVRRAKPRAFRIATRGIDGVATRMIGRDAELEALQSAFVRLFAERKLAAVTVVAEAGVGKSRLLTEFETWSEARPELFFIFRGRANPNCQAQPYGLLRDILAWRLQIADDDTIEAAKDKLEKGIVPLFLHDDGEDMAEGHAHLLGHLLGIDYSASRHIRGIHDDPRQIRNRAFHTAAQVFRRVTAGDGSPIVLELEDLHWADDASLDFLVYLTQVNRDVPMLILTMARPTLFERRADWMSTESVHTRIDIAPLDQSASRMLANELLKKLAEVPAGLREMIAGGSEGNPFYMEELVKMLVDQGAIETSGPHGERWTLHADKLQGTTVPPTLTGVLQARLDGLPASERLALQQASVIGAVFWDRALFALDPRAEQSLPALVRRELAVPHDGATLADGLREYAFTHHLLHQVTYETVLKRMRRAAHAKVAAWLVELSGAKSDIQHAKPLRALIAEHFEKAGDARNACEYYTRAAEYAATRYAHDVLLEASNKALALADADNLATRWRLHTVRERYFDTQGQRDAQSDAIAALHTLAEAMADDARRAEVAWRRAYLAFRIGDYPTSQAHARRGLEWAQCAAAQPLVLRCQHMLAIALCSQGELDAGKAMAQDGLAQARASGDRKMEVRFVNAMAVTTQSEDDLIGGYGYDLEVLRLCREIGNRRDEAVALSNLGNVLIGLGDSAQARSYLEEGLRIARAVGARFVEPHLLHHMAELELQLGNAAAAREYGQAALAMSQAMQDRSSESVCALALAEAELRLGNPAAAQAGYERALALCIELDNPNQLDAKAGLARLALARDEPRQAAAHVEELLAYFDLHRNFDGTVSAQVIHMSCYRVLERLGDPRAASVLDDAHRDLQAQAVRISDVRLRECFLTQIPVNRDIVLDWRAAQSHEIAR